MIRAKAFAKTLKNAQKFTKSTSKDCRSQPARIRRVNTLFVVPLNGMFKHMQSQYSLNNHLLESVNGVSHWLKSRLILSTNSSTNLFGFSQQIVKNIRSKSSKRLRTGA